MKIPEPPPTLTSTNQTDFTVLPLAKELKPFFDRVLDEAFYWDKVKYLKLPQSIDNKQFWLACKLLVIPEKQIKIGKYTFNAGLGIFHAKTLHEFDLNFGGNLLEEGQISDADKNRFLVSSIMEEAISSSLIEGAVTTRKDAREMLLQNRKPANKSERMIYNNFITIQRIKELVKEKLTEQHLLEIQALITHETLDNEQDAGIFRNNNNINVVDEISAIILHSPPSFTEIPQAIQAFISFFNDEDQNDFIHPIVKASIIHFFIGFLHPFADGNGRTARALFYWYLLKKGYWLTEFLSVSSIILNSKEAYAKAYLYAESDIHPLSQTMELRYFVHYKLNVLTKAYGKLKDYIKRKQEERAVVSDVLKMGGINERQAVILGLFNKEPQKIITVKEIENRFGIVNQSARTDLKRLVDLGFLETSFVNKKKQIFFRSSKFETLFSMH